MTRMQAAWIAIDWGTSNLRGWAMSPTGTVLARAESARGMATIAAQKGDFETALRELIQPWLRAGEVVRVIGCGMVGARQGWIEVPYDPVPCAPQTRLTKAPVRSRDFEFLIRSGVRQDEPADVMRGEETQIAGLLAGAPDFSGLICLPGTHSKWVKVSAGRIQSFRTYLTGEVFALLAGQSVLRHTLATEGWDEAAFLDALQTALQKPAEMLAQCFGLRAESLLHQLDGTASRSRLSGILIGQELAAVLHGFPEGESVALIGAPAIAQIYRSALASVGRSAEIFDVEAMTLAGLGPAEEAA